MFAKRSRFGSPLHMILCIAQIDVQPGQSAERLELAADQTSLLAPAGCLLPAGHCLAFLSLEEW